MSINTINEKIFYFFHNFANESAFIDAIIVFCADILPYVVLMLAGLFLLFHHEVFKAESPFAVFLQKKKEILRAFFAGFLAYILSVSLKNLVKEPRPFEAMPDVSSLLQETGYAFPSSHATFFMALALSIYFFHKKAGYLFLTFALIIGLARVVAGVHFPVDILGGFALGGLIAYFLKNV